MCGRNRHTSGRPQTANPLEYRATICCNHPDVTVHTAREAAVFRRSRKLTFHQYTFQKCPLVIDHQNVANSRPQDSDRSDFRPLCILDEVIAACHRRRPPAPSQQRLLLQEAETDATKHYVQLNPTNAALSS